MHCVANGSEEQKERKKREEKERKKRGIEKRKKMNDNEKLLGPVCFIKLQVL